MTSRKMPFLKLAVLLMSLSTIAALVGCSSSSKPPITVTLSTTPSSLYVNDFISVTATTNDTAGVTWSCTPSGSCGSFSAATSTSGNSVTYTAPSAAGSVTIVATSVTNTAVSANAAITINPTSGYTVTLSTPPPASLPTNGTATIAATTTDPSGVSWSCTPAGSCGSFSPTTSATGVTVTYTAPATAGTVTIIADSVSDDAISANATVAVTSAVVSTLAAGNYVFSVSGIDDNSSTGTTPYYYAGAFTVSSTGTITGGEQDFNDLNYNTAGSTAPYTPEAITGGSITQSADGNLLITLTFSDPYINGGAGTITLDASVVSASEALLTEYDDWATGSGELDAQATGLVTPGPASYAIVDAGQDISFDPLSIGGVINIDDLASTTGTISGAGSEFDENDDGTTLVAGWGLGTGSNIAGPDSFGFVTITLFPSSASGIPEIILDGYMVDSNHIRLIENWNAEFAVGGLQGYTGGTALAQTVPTGGFTSTSISGNSFVFGVTGADTVSLVDDVAGALTFNSDGSVTGNVSFNDLTVQAPQGGTALEAESTTTPCSSGSATTACYTVDPLGTGRVTITNVTDGATFNYTLELYLVGDTPGHATLISMDNGSQGADGTTDILAGLGWQQSSGLSAASLSGSYALDLGQVVDDEWANSVGSFDADGLGTSSTSIDGFVDANLFLVDDTQAADESLTAGYTAGTTNGVLLVTPSGGGSGILLTAYQADPTQGVVIENDNGGLTLGYFDQQSTSSSSHVRRSQRSSSNKR
jgi:hypothetical protein